jgi:hypothetical protein
VVRQVNGPVEVEVVLGQAGGGPRIGVDGKTAPAAAASESPAYVAAGAGAVVATAPPSQGGGDSSSARGAAKAGGHHGHATPPKHGVRGGNRTSKGPSAGASAASAGSHGKHRITGSVGDDTGATAEEDEWHIL